MTAAVGVLTGWLLDRALGDPRRGHPVAGFGRLAGAVEARLHRDARGRGVAFTALLVGGPAVAAHAAARGLGRVGRTLWLATLVWTALGARSLGREAQAVADAVAAGDLDTARARIPALVGRDPARLDADGLCRAAVESVAENTADAVVAPFVAAALWGPAGVVAHRCANTLDAMVGHRTPRHGRFGWASARLDDVLGWLPARVTALLAAAAAPLVGGSPRAVVVVWRLDGARHPSPNAGRCEAAFAGALGVRLGGVNDYGAGGVEVRGPHGEGPPPGPGDVRRAVLLSTAVGMAAAVLAAAATAVRPAPPAPRPRGVSPGRHPLTPSRHTVLDPAVGVSRGRPERKPSRHTPARRRGAAA